MQVAELVTKIGFQGSLKPIKDLQSNLKTSISSIAKYSAVAIGATAATAALVRMNMKHNQGIVNNARNLDMSVEKYQRLEDVANDLNTPFENVTSSVTNLQKKIGEASLKGSSDFFRLGVSVRDEITGGVRSVDDVLDDVQKRLKSGDFSVSQVQSLAGQLGIDSDFILRLKDSKKTFKELVASANGDYLITDDQVEKIEDFNKSMSSMMTSTKRLTSQFMIALSPAVKTISKNFSDWLSNNKDLVKNGLQKVSDITLLLGKKIASVAGTIDNVVSSTIGWKAAILGVIALKFPVATALAGIALVLDDVIVGFMDGKSVIKDFISDLAGVENSVKSLQSSEAIKSFQKTMAAPSQFSGASVTAAGVATVQAAKYGEDRVVNIDGERYRVNKRMVTRLGDSGLKPTKDQKLTKDQVDMIMKAYKGESLSGNHKVSISDTNGQIIPIKSLNDQYTPQAIQKSMSNRTTNNSSQSITNSPNIKIEVSSNGDAGETAKAITNALKLDNVMGSMFKQADYQFSRGGF